MALAVCSVGQVLICQIYMMTLQVFIQTVLIGCQVFDSKFKTKIEYFNEIIIIFVLYSVFGFSPWIKDVVTRFKIGYFAIGIVSLHLIVNISIILGGSFKDIQLRCRIRKIKKSYNKQRK